jgi:hypothetical protein
MDIGIEIDANVDIEIEAPVVEIEVDANVDIEVEAEIEIEGDVEIEVEIEAPVIEIEVEIEAPVVEIEVEIEAPVVESQVDLNIECDLNAPIVDLEVEAGGSYAIMAKSTGNGGAFCMILGYIFFVLMITVAGFGSAMANNGTGFGAWLVLGALLLLGVSGMLFCRLGWAADQKISLSGEIEISA